MDNNKKQTAVERLEKELKERYPLINSEPLFDQAKEMEKQQHDIEKCKAALELFEGHKDFKVSEVHINQLKAELMYLQNKYSETFESE